MTGKGRPRTGTPVLVRIPADLLAQLDLDADTNGRKRAEQIRQILTHYYLKEP